MNVEISDLRAFVAVVDLGSFALAAHELHLSQSALSRRISKLEANLGVRLLERTTRRVEVSAPGRAFAVKARQVVNGFDESLLDITDAASRLTGEITIACVPTAVNHLLPKVLHQYQQQFPGILVRVMDEGASEALALVVRGEADFGINYLGAQEGNITFTPLFDEPFVLACPIDHPLSKRKSVSWSELSEQRYIAVNKASGNRMLLDWALANTPQVPKPVLEARHVRTAVDMVASGLGVAAVPQLAISKFGLDGLVKTVPLINPSVNRTLGLLTRRSQFLSPAAQRFCSLIQQENPLSEVSTGSEIRGQKVISRSAQSRPRKG
ncbi:LysR family transcriptional regulator [Pseudomonas sp. LS-2]|uniref:LysR family transcriptional regulator n=1 Tax=Pseudomonas sp. LS-2 TaxID=2315859 RepID=UPI000E7456FD|nr:LysR family transcriptional regulator [Pseudomonas sp. LS-2]RJX75012.1 LysR family transcriptional regulator [Pseudomonas sp. LS-2]